MTWKALIAAAAISAVLAPAIAQADSSIGAVEGARAKERQGTYLSRQDRENLRRWGGNDDYGYRYGRGPYVYSGAYYDDGDYDYGPSVGIYIGPGY